MNYTQLIQDFEESEEGGKLPTRWAICHACRGEGSSCAHLGAFTQSDREEMGEEWYEFADDMRRGVYDQPCDTCQGSGKVKEVELEALVVNKPLYDAWLSWEQDAYYDDQVQRMERMMGA